MKKLMVLVLWIPIAGCVEDHGLTQEKVTAANNNKNPPVYQGRPARAWIKNLEDRDSLVRYLAVEALIAIGKDDDLVVPALIKVVQKDSDPAIRRAATRGLGRIGPAAKRAVPVFVNALTKGVNGKVEDIELFKEMIKALGSIGPASEPAVPVFVDVLEGKNKFTYDWYDLVLLTTDALGDIGSAARAAVPSLIQAQKHINSQSFIKDDFLNEKVGRALKKINVGGTSDAPPSPRLVAQRYLEAVSREDWATATRISVLGVHPRLAAFDEPVVTKPESLAFEGKLLGLAVFHARINKEYRFNPQRGAFESKDKRRTTAGQSYDDLLAHTNVSLTDVERQLAKRYGQDQAKWDRLIGQSFLSLSEATEFKLYEACIGAGIGGEAEHSGQPAKTISVHMVRFVVGNIDTGWRVWQVESMARVRGGRIP